MKCKHENIRTLQNGVPKCAECGDTIFEALPEDVREFTEPVETYESLVIEAMKDAHKLQNFLWDSDNWLGTPYAERDWHSVFQKRVDAIARIDTTQPSWKVELRKRLLQQASLSLKAIMTLNNLDDTGLDKPDKV